MLGVMTTRATPPGRRMWLRGILFAVVGAGVGFTAAYLLYMWLNPILEAKRDLLREAQGLLFTIVPLATALGGWLGWMVASRLDRR